MLRSLKVSNGWLKRVKQALNRYDFSSQKALAEELEISSRKASDFFNGKSVDHEIFVAICARLGLDWQKVAKVPAEMVKGNAVTSHAPVPNPEIANQVKTIEEQFSKNEGIPKLASSLFRAFDSQVPIAQKKFITTTNPPSEVGQSEQSLDQLIDQAIDQLVDEIEADSNDPLPEAEILEIVNQAIEDSSENQQFTQNTIDKEGLDQIQELLGLEPNLPSASSTFNPTTIVQIQDLLGIAPSEPAEIETESPLPTKISPISDLTKNLDTAISEQAQIEQPVIAKVEFEISLEMAKPEQVKLPQKLREEVLIPQLIPPSSELSHNLDTILANYYGSCQSQDWDMAAAIANGINLAYIKKNSDLSIVLDLYNQLLPLKWQEGAQKVSDRLTHWQVLYNAGMTAFYLGKYADACAYYETALAIASKLAPSTTLKIKVLNGIGTVYQVVAQHQKAIKYFQQSQALAKESQDHGFQLQAFSNLGNVYYALRQYRTAIAYYQEFLQFANQEGASKEAIELEFSIIGNLGNAYYNLKEYQKAISYQGQYLEIARLIGNPEKVAGCLVSLGFNYYALGLLQTAIEQYNQAKAIADQYAYPRIQVSVFSGLGLSYQALKNYPMAIVCFHKCLELSRELGDRSSEIKALYNLRKANSYQYV